MAGAPSDADARIAAAEARAAESDRKAAALAEEIAALKAAAAAPDTLAASLAAARLAPPPPPPPPPPRYFFGVTAALLSAPPHGIASPSMRGAESIQNFLATVDTRASPLTPALTRLSASRALARWHGLEADALLSEVNAYPRATAHVPAWVVARERPAHKGGDEAASTLFLAPGEAPPDAPGFIVPWTCRPELLTAPRERFHPAFNGEVKSVVSGGESAMRNPRLFDELLTYALLGMLGSYFRDVPARAHRFFPAPPLAYALAVAGPVGFLVAVEWVGQLLGSFVSEPFFLGSAAHAAAVAALPDSAPADRAFVDLRVDGMRVAVFPVGAGERPTVIWRTAPLGAAAGAAADEGAGAGAGAGVGADADADKVGDDGRFFKILRGDGFDAAFFRRIYQVYGAYAAARALAAAAGAAAPSALLEAELLFGVGEVCVRMPWARGRDAVSADLDVRDGAVGVAVAPVADAIVWLARRGLLYIDVREPNVRVDDATGAVALVDYDDVVLLDAPPAGFDELLGLMRRHSPLANPAGGPGAWPAIVAEMRRLW